MKNLKFVILYFAVVAVVGTGFARPVHAADTDMQIQMIENEIRQLRTERDNKKSELEKCAKSVKGFQIAGIVTLTATAGLGVVNIVQAGKIKDLNAQIGTLDNQIATKKKEIEVKKQEIAAAKAREDAEEAARLEKEKQANEADLRAAEQQKAAAQMGMASEGIFLTSDDCAKNNNDQPCATVTTSGGTVYVNDAAVANAATGPVPTVVTPAGEQSAEDWNAQFSNEVGKRHCEYVWWVNGQILGPNHKTRVAHGATVDCSGEFESSAGITIAKRTCVDGKLGECLLDGQPASTEPAFVPDTKMTCAECNRQVADMKVKLPDREFYCRNEGNGYCTLTTKKPSPETKPEEKSKGPVTPKPKPNPQPGPEPQIDLNPELLTTQCIYYETGPDGAVKYFLSPGDVMDCKSTLSANKRDGVDTATVQCGTDGRMSDCIIRACLDTHEWNGNVCVKKSQSPKPTSPTTTVPGTSPGTGKVLPELTLPKSFAEREDEARDQSQKDCEAQIGPMEPCTCKLNFSTNRYEKQCPGNKPAATPQNPPKENNKSWDFDTNPVQLTIEPMVQDNTGIAIYTSPSQLKSTTPPTPTPVIPTPAGTENSGSILDMLPSGAGEIGRVGDGRGYMGGNLRF